MFSSGIFSSDWWLYLTCSRVESGRLQLEIIIIDHKASDFNKKSALK